MRRFTLTLVLFGTAVAAAFAAPQLMPAPVHEMHVAPVTGNATTAGPLDAPAPLPEPVLRPASEPQIGTIATIPELSEPPRPPMPLRPPMLRLPPDPVPEPRSCEACGRG